MDLVICEAPLDNSFQKEKLVLVNKGSLGRRRKPSRANLKLLLSPSADTSLSTTSAKSISQPSPINSVTKSAPTTPVYEEQKIIVNRRRENNSSRYSNTGLRIESSLPRTPPEPNQYVNDAQQFTIEAKLKRRKSDTGRSAVLIQTWERRTRCDSFSRLTKPKTIARTNRFQNKENMGGATIMHDSHSTYPNHNGGAKKDRWSKGGEIVASVRDGPHNGTMVHRNTVNDFSHRKVYTQQYTNHRKQVEKEPEWISLSRKLRAKFVEGHIGDQDSADSYPHEEPEGVDQDVPKLSPVLPSIKISNELHKTTVQQPTQKPEKKIRVVVDTSETINENGEPPWVQLSRKLCTKFIEEHIEYPLISGDVPVQVSPEALECNGDVRIIEKIGTKEKRSKSRKDSEPEWISLSKKLRAKFIESHIDDPDTISLDNQLNASDPEETSSESLSDSSPEVSPVKKFHIEPKNVECNDSKSRCLNGNDGTSVTYTQPNGLSFAEKECCWEYQEMEFDQESSGTFNDPESLEENLLNNSEKDSHHHKSYNGYTSQNKPAQYVSEVQVYPNILSFAETVNMEPFYNAECYNNDVRFPPAYVDNSTTFAHLNHQGGPETSKKHITVQIVSRPSLKVSDSSSKMSSPDMSPTNISPVATNGNDFFNISTWEEAHFVSDDAKCERNQPCPEAGLVKSFISKSMDNICDGESESGIEKTLAVRGKDKSKIGKLGASLVDLNSISKSETVLDQLDIHAPCENNIRNFKEDNHKNTKKFSETPVFPNKSNADSFTKPQDNIDVQIPKSNKNVEKSQSKSKQEACVSKKQPICNGVIPNSVRVAEKNTTNVNVNSHMVKQNTCNGKIEVKSVQKQTGSVYVNEYANINPLTDSVTTYKERHNSDEKPKAENTNKPSIENGSSNSISVSNDGSSYALVKKSSTDKDRLNPENINRNMNILCDKQENGVLCEKSTPLKMKSKSLCDISNQKEYASSSDDSSLVQNQGKNRQNGRSPNSTSSSTGFSALKFQHFASEADIPLCAKLVKQNGKISTSSISSSSNRNGSPCSESSHVYEDMFKETTSCPSDSETSSWTVMKNNSYYINGRSSSMNDLDYSDSCSMSVKCDYASSCSEHSTLQSRHSSVTSSSFYVNLRDYDSHMLEPSLSRRKEHNKSVCNGNSSKPINSNPPTPESLRHLFTSPFNSIPKRGNKVMNKPEPEIHYYSTAAIASTAFKHGFDPSPPKPKKTERSSSIKIKDIAHGIILTFKKFQNHSKSSHVSSTHYVDVSHLAENGIKPHGKPKKDHKNGKRDRKGFWGNKTDSDSGCPLSASEIQRAKARRASSDLTGLKPKFTVLSQNPLFIDDEAAPEIKKSKNGKKSSNARDKARKNRSKSVEPKTIPTVSRKVQQLADGTFYLVTTVSGDTALPGVYSDSPDTSSELSTDKPVKPTGESNC